MTTAFHLISCGDFDDFAEKVQPLLNCKHKWVFRGEKDATEHLKTSLEKTCERFEVRGGDRVKTEDSMIREFQRRAHHYTSHAPSPDAVDEWMALMRHYGAPSRLLDVTYSPYVAAYFAFAFAESTKNVAIWAVNTTWCEKQLKVHGMILYEQYLRYERDRRPEAFKAIFMTRPFRKLVVAATPYRLNERLASQRGAFLCPGDATVGFEENLSTFAGTENLHDKVIKFTIHTWHNGLARNRALKRLDEMNINGITLFPDLQGFAESFEPRTLFFKDMRWP